MRREMSSTKQSGGGRMAVEEVRGRLIEAATHLLRQRPPSEVSVREIASRAGVNHGLVHRHFGGKDALVAAVLESIFRKTGRAIVDTLDADPEEAVYRGMKVLMGERWIAAVVAHLLLSSGTEGIPEASMMPVFRRRAGEDPDERLRMVVAVGESAVLGWMLFEPLVARGTGFDSMDEDARLRLFSATLTQHLRGLLDGSRSSM